TGAGGHAAAGALHGQRGHDRGGRVLRRPPRRRGRPLVRLVGVSVKGWTIVFEGHRIQADLVAAALEADGLRVEVFGDNAYGVGVDLTEARVMVQDRRAQTAYRSSKEAHAL